MSLNLKSCFFFFCLVKISFFGCQLNLHRFLIFARAPPGWLSGEHLGPGGCEFDPQLRQLFFAAYFHLSRQQKHVRKVVGGFGKKSSVSTSVRKPGNTYATLTAMI